MATLRFDLSRRAVRRLGWSLLALNLVFTAGTALFINEWNHRDWHGPLGRWIIDRVLVQFHLATENVVAAWYSSMLLLSVGVAAALTFAVERRATAVHREDRESSGSLVKNGSGRLLTHGWLLVAIVFAGLSLDELGSFHERLGMLHRQGVAAVGWVYVLIVPIVLVGLFLLAFAWVRLRRVAAAAALFAVGTLLFLADPVLELAEMALLRAGRGNDLFVHNMLLVIEEGIVELGGALCFLLGTLIYIRRTAGDGPHTFTLGDSAAVLASAIAALAMTAAVPAAHWFVALLPPGDTGIPDDWFPAAMLYLLAIAVLANRGRRALPEAGVALALSAAAGAALYGYLGWFVRIGYPGEALDAALTAAAGIVLCVEAAREPRLPSP